MAAPKFLSVAILSPEIRKLSNYLVFFAADLMSAEIQKKYRPSAKYSNIFSNNHFKRDLCETYKMYLQIDL